MAQSSSTEGAANIRAGRAVTSYADAHAEILHWHHGMSFEINMGAEGAPAKRIDPPDTYMVKLRNVVCIPGQVLLCEDGRILPDSFRRNDVTSPHPHLKIRDDGFLPTRHIDDAADIAEPVFYLDGEQASHFGHWTLEVLSRLWPLVHHQSLTELKFVTSSKLVEHVKTVLTSLGVLEQNIIYFNKPIRCREIYIASQGYILDRSASEEVYDLWRKIGSKFLEPGTPEKIYVGRLQFNKQRNLINEDKVSSVFKRLGFTVISPETLSVKDQIKIFAAAKCIAGPSGSNVYGAIYSQTQGKRLFMSPEKFVLPNDPLIAHATRSLLRVVTGQAVQNGRGPMFDDWEIDISIVEEAASMMFGG
ncbi:glycosyltransferase family 61 protein [Rhizobium sp. SYY.PMSO]|uniref:glycosyltransferase family 61 protein n=1 Tax=Rhizobium sp. SYY.PMSO TaxID=3382192 RepID=UPI00398FF9FD